MVEFFFSLGVMDDKTIQNDDDEQLHKIIRHIHRKIHSIEHPWNSKPMKNDEKCMHKEKNL